MTEPRVDKVFVVLDEEDGIVDLVRADSHKELARFLRKVGASGWRILEHEIVDLEAFKTAIEEEFAELEAGEDDDEEEEDDEETELDDEIEP